MRLLHVAYVLVLASIVAAAYLYPSMPEMMASHWNAAGEVDGYMSRFWGIFLFPVISAALLLLFAVLPRIDPMKNNIEAFKSYYEGFVLIFVIFMLYLYALTLLFSQGFTFNMTLALIPAFAALFLYVGLMLPNIKKNWFIGIRTPWTMSSDAVWDKTHNMAGKLFIAAAAISMLGLFFPKHAFLLMIMPILAAVLYIVVYSYFEYAKQKKL